MEKQQFFRLAATLVADDSFPDSIVSVRTNLIDGMFIGFSNELKTARELQEHCERRSAVALSIDEIEESLDNGEIYEKAFNRAEPKYRIRPERYIALSAQLSKKSLDYYLAEFADLQSTKADFRLEPEGIRSVLYKFLYHVMNNNLMDFQKVANNSLRALPETPVGQQFSEGERVLINKFLEWENPEKNRVVFKASTLGLEYCVLSNTNYFNLMETLGISPKTFYLDTNVIFRALGINGVRRQELVRMFLRKCQSTGQGLRISPFTNSEFRESIDFHLTHIQEYGNVNPQLFVEYSAQEDIYNFFYEWKSHNYALGTTAFKAHVLKQYEDLQHEFKISIDDRLPFRREDQEFEEKVFHYSRSIDNYKRQAPRQSWSYDIYVPDKSIFDAQNVVLVEAYRETSSKPYSDVSSFLVSADHLLLNWDHGRHNVTPVVMLPTHWLSLMLRFATRTSDDYRSFVSFINLPRSADIITNEQLSAVLEGVGQITAQGPLQEDILKRILDAKMDTILRSRKPGAIVEKAKLEAAKIRDEEMNALRASLEEKNRSDASSSELLAAKEAESTAASQLVGQLETRVSTLVGYIRKNHQLAALRRWRRPVWFLLASATLAVAYLLMQWLGLSNPWNIPLVVAQYVDGLKSATVQRVFTGLNYGIPIGLVGWLTKLGYSRLFSKKARKEFLEGIEYPNADELLVQLRSSVKIR